MIEYAYRDSLRPRKNRLTSCSVRLKKFSSLSKPQRSSAASALFVLTILDLQSGKTCEARGAVKNFVVGILYP